MAHSSFTNPPRFEQHESGIRVSTDAWQIEHLAAAGGAWSSLVFAHGSGKNLLRRPLSSALRFVRPDPRSESGVFSGFWERHETQPRLWLEENGGVSAVVAEGTYRDENGSAIPVGFRRRTEYHPHGLVWTTLDIMSDSGCGGVVEVRALDLALRAGMTDCFVRFHPSQAGGADLLGARAWYDLTRCSSQGGGKQPPAGRQTGVSAPPKTVGGADTLVRHGPVTPFISRFTPLQILCIERGVEGIELFPGSELAQWDCAFKPEPGLGLYRVSQDGDGASIELDPYCLAYRRLAIEVRGRVSLRLGIGLPELKPRARTFSTSSHATISSHSTGEAEFARLAQAGMKLVRYQDDYREDGTFWRAGAYPPYDESGMAELRRAIDCAHRHGLKIVPCVSLKELHPDTPAYREHAREWMHMAAPSLDVIHTWAGSGEFGGLMCMKSGWLDFRKRSVDQVLAGLPWDGLYLDGAEFLPCCHPGHALGPFHTDIDGWLEFLSYCREKTGPDGVLFVNLSGAPSIMAENLAGLVLVGEDHSGIAPLPAQSPPQCDFIPIAPRTLNFEP